MARASKAAPQLTTAQQLGSIVKSARDIMRKDKGLNGDLDRLPMLTWLMFLKFLDDHEYIRQNDAELRGKEFHPTIEAPYRWRDWGARPRADLLDNERPNVEGEGYKMTGDDLIAFINNDEANRPDNTRGPGLFYYLRHLHGNGEGRRRVVANVFSGTVNRMRDGYLLRDVISLVDRINFSSSDEIFTLGNLYETMLKEMRDAAGDAGEFYTPRAVVQFMVEATDPKLGERVLDPACGTGGFLVAAYKHMKEQAHTAGQDSMIEQSISGVEAKSLPYLLAEMNLLLHGMESPNIAIANSLAVKLGEIGESERVDVIMTNPPFGGEEQKGIADGFTYRTSETALLFLQLIMRKLRKQHRQGFGPARAAMVVPNGTLFATGVAAQIKEELLRDFNLHTIVRLPNGVFSPYTSIPTNLLFFAWGGPTEEVWYYELPLPEGKKNYTKTQPMQFEEFAPLLAWWQAREENDHAWRIPAAQIAANGYNLDIKNPSRQQDFAHMEPAQLADDILQKEQRIAEIMAEIKQVLAGVA